LPSSLLVSLLPSSRYKQAEIAPLYNPFLKHYTCRYAECKTKLEDVISNEIVMRLKATHEMATKEFLPIVLKLEELPRKRNSAEKK
jgi:hypothetical protein